MKYKVFDYRTFRVLHLDNTSKLIFRDALHDITKVYIHVLLYLLSSNYIEKLEDSSRLLRPHEPFRDGGRAPI